MYTQDQKQALIATLIQKLFPYADADWCIIRESSPGTGEYTDLKSYWMSHFDEALQLSRKS